MPGCFSRDKVKTKFGVWFGEARSFSGELPLVRLACKSSKRRDLLTIMRLGGSSDSAAGQPVEADVELQYKRAPVSDSGGTARGRPLFRRVSRIEGCSTSRFVLAAVFIGAVISAFVTLDAHFLEDAMEWMRSSPVHGPFVFVMLYCAAVVLLVPGTLLSLCAGAMFKWEAGTMLVWVGQSVGQVLAFAVGRYLLRDVVVHNLTARYRKFAAVDAALEREGWKLVVLLRLSPIIPWNVLNYLLSVTGVSMVSYAVASAFAVLPWLSLFTYVGSMAHTLADVLNGSVSPDTSTSLIIGVVSGVLLVAAVLYTGYVSKRAIAEAFRDNSNTLPGGEEGSGSDEGSGFDEEFSLLPDNGAGLFELVEAPEQHGMQQAQGAAAGSSVRAWQRPGDAAGEARTS